MIGDFDRNLEPKIKEIEKAYNKTAVKNAKALHKKGELAGETETVEVHFAVYGRHCTDVEAVRKRLDSGILYKMLAKAQAKLRPSYSGEYDADGYKFILLGACGMSLGCELPDSTLALMRKHYQNVGLMRDAKKQMEKALDEETGYKIGIPWDFGSLGRKEMHESGQFAAEEDRIYPGMINVEEPGSRAVKSPAETMRKFQEQLAMLNICEEMKHMGHVCGECGAENGKNGGQLLQCAKCKKRKYCSTECQTKHWKHHKLMCGD